LLVFTGYPRTSEHEQDSFVLCYACTLAKSAAKVLHKVDIRKHRTQKDQKGLGVYARICVSLQKI